ncbi:MAG: hypothetical protein MZV64_19110 [Ignavibacteriales bacterium]|nr:hypothetical protein [Ignavibacteriales bacterium]
MWVLPHTYLHPLRLHYRFGSRYHLLRALLSDVGLVRLGQSPDARLRPP